MSFPSGMSLFAEFQRPSSVGYSNRHDPQIHGFPHLLLRHHIVHNFSFSSGRNPRWFCSSWFSISSARRRPPSRFTVHVPGFKSTSTMSGVVSFAHYLHGFVIVLLNHHGAVQGPPPTPQYDLILDTQLIKRFPHTHLIRAPGASPPAPLPIFP